MRIYVVPDVHGSLEELKTAMSLIQEDLQSEGVKLIFLGDYIHGGENSIGVVDYIMNLQEEFGRHKVIALLGNHEEFVLKGYSSLEVITPTAPYEIDDKYIDWLQSLPRFYQESNTIFVHAGIDEALGRNWEYTDDYTLTSKYPAVTGKIEGLELKVVAGHVYTSEIANNDGFSDIYYDGFNHYYLDGNVIKNKKLNVMLVETSEGNDNYYEVIPDGNILVSEYF
ncbi:metallophosphoesterase [Peptoniphilaceae bacterium SGI.137]